MTDKRPVVVTTSYRGVFFGYATDTTGDRVTLHDARNCIYWSAETGGFMGLGAVGPQKGSKIGATVSQIDLRSVTSVIECTPAAVEAWKSSPVHGR